MSAHVIRLRGHWKRDELPDGRVRHSRHFGRPRTLDANETAWLVGTSSPGDGSLLLNDQFVGTVTGGEPFAFDVTRSLLPRNLVAIEVNAGETVGDAALEIRAESSVRIGGPC